MSSSLLPSNDILVEFVAEAGVIQLHSEFNVPGKTCATDRWQGNMQTLMSYTLAHIVQRAEDIVAEGGEDMSKGTLILLAVERKKVADLQAANAALTQEVANKAEYARRMYNMYTEASAEVQRLRAERT